MTKFKELKKTVAGIMAMAMVFIPVMSGVVSTTALAANQTDPLSGNVIASENGTEGYVSTNAFNVTLPTISANNVAFKLDPQGLLSVSGNDAVYENVEAGNIVFTGKVSGNELTSLSSNYDTSNVFYATNKSSYDITFSIDASLSNTAASENAVTFVSNNAAVSANTDRNIYFAVVPETNYISYNRVSENGFQALSVNAATGYAQALTQKADGSAAASLAFRVSGNENNYGFTKDASGNYAYEITNVSANDWKTVGFSLTGACNPNADWYQFDQDNENLELTIAWTLTKAADTEAYGAGCPDGMIKAVPAATEITTLGYNTTTRAFWITIPGETTANVANVSNFTITPTGGSATAFTSSSLGATNASVTISWANISAAGLAWPTGSSYTFTFTYNGVPYYAVYTA